MKLIMLPIILTCSPIMDLDEPEAISEVAEEQETANQTNTPKWICPFCSQEFERPVVHRCVDTQTLK